MSDRRAYQALFLVSLLLAILCSLGMGCNALQNYDKIGDVLSSPAKYENKDVRVQGRVVELLSAPIVGTYALLDDGTGQLWCEINTTAVVRGQTVSVNGRVRAGVDVLMIRIGLVLVENKPGFR